ncbi:hypothetical protein BH09BAC3_BH09BAC3_24650 [soil metagenome]
MEKSTFRIIKSIGMFLFLLLFGVFIYAITRTENSEWNELTLIPESDPQDLDGLHNPPSENKPIGFDYKRISETEKKNQS